MPKVRFEDKIRRAIHLTPEMDERIDTLYPLAKKKAKADGVHLTINEMLVGALEVGLDSIEDYLTK
jgi:predicted DNA-binding protein